MLKPDHPYEALPYLPVRKAMGDAMWEAMREGRALGSRDTEPDFDQVKYGAAWDWMHYYRGAGKMSAYGPFQQTINDEANSHALRGFLVGWAMCEAMHRAQRDRGEGAM